METRKNSLREESERRERGGKMTDKGMEKKSEGSGTPTRALPEKQSHNLARSA